MKRMCAARWILSMLIALIAGGAFAESPGPSQTPLPITIGYQANTDWLLFVARDLKLFEQAGLAPNFVKFEAGPEMISQAKEKHIDVTSVGTVPFLLGLAEGVDWEIVGVNPEEAFGEGLVARSGSGIVTIADLAGKRIGVVKGSNAHFGLITALHQLGISRDQVSMLDMSPADQLTALASNEIDAAWVWEPWMQKMSHEANARVIITEGDMGIYSAVSVYAARREWVMESRETAVRFVRAILLAGEVVKKDPKVGIKALAAEMGIKEDWAEDIYENVPPPKVELWSDPRYRYSLVRHSRFHRRLGYLGAFLFDESIIPERVDVRNVLDVSLVTDALKAAKAGQ